MSSEPNQLDLQYLSTKAHSNFVSVNGFSFSSDVEDIDKAVNSPRPVLPEINNDFDAVMDDIEIFNEEASTSTNVTSNTTDNIKIVSKLKLKYDSVVIML